MARETRMTAGWVAALLILAAACAESPAGPNPAPSQLERLPRELTAAEVGIISANNEFAFDLLREAAATAEGDNVFLSPLSASMALGMTMNGTAGETYAQMRTALGFGQMEPAAINQSYRTLIDLLLELDPAVDTRLANSIWYREVYPFEESFFDVARTSFSAEVTGLPFVPSDRDRINDWVKEATGGKIPEIVEAITADHVMFLINAVYFKGSWTDRFDRADTRTEPFLLAGGGQVAVPMMKRDGMIAVAVAPSYRAVELPYGNGAFAMTLVVPVGDRTVDDLVTTMDAEQWRQITAALHPRESRLAMPRFTLEYRQTLNDALRALGIVNAFQASLADFTPMSSHPGLEISEVLQKTFIDVNEEGTEAAAATSVGVVATSAPGEFRVDRPFLLAIRERFSGTILFLGRIGDPS